MSIFVLLPALLVVALVGWVAGMWTHKRSLLWCAACGQQLQCVTCARRTQQPLDVQGRRS